MLDQDTQSVSQRQSPEDESQTPPHVPLPALSSSQPIRVAEHESVQVKPSWFMLDPSPPQRNSIAQMSLSSVTAYEEEPNTISPRLWSCPTWNDTCSQAPTIFGCADSIAIHNHQPGPDLEAFGAWSHSAPIAKWPEKSHLGHSEDGRHRNWTLEPILNRFLTRLPKLSEFLDKHKFRNSLKDIGPYSSLNEFLLEDPKEMPWTSFNVRLPGSICALCGSPFTGPNHMENVAAHIRIKHCQPLQHQSQASHKHFTHYRNTPSMQWNEANAMGSWAHQDILRSRKASNVTSITKYQHRVIDCDNPAIPHDRLLFLLNSLDPSVNPRRANNFFNAFDLILGNLLDKSPGDVVVLGIQSALARLEHLYGINFGSSTTRQSKWTSSSTTEGVRVCAGSQDKSASGNFPSKSPPTSSRGNGQKRESTESSRHGGKSLGNRQNVSKKAQRRRKAEIDGTLLACPFKKNCEVYGQALCCDFEGEPSMSDVTQHLHRRVHSQALGFLALCRDCWQYIRDPREYHNSHGSGGCNMRIQPKGLRVAQQWYSLYRLLFPHSERIPSPYVGDMTWKSVHTFNNQQDFDADEEEGEPEFDFNTFPTSQSFLEPSLPVPLNEPPPAHDLLVQSRNVSIPDAEASATELFGQMLSEHVQQPYDLIDHYTSSLVDNASQLPPEQLDAFSSRLHARVSEIIDSARARTREPRALPSGVNSVNMQLGPSGMQSARYSNIVSPEGQWIGQFPVPPHLREVHEQSHSAPEQSTWDYDHLLQSHEELDILSGPSNVTYSTFFPDISFDQMFHRHDLVSRDASGTHTAMAV